MQKYIVIVHGENLLVDYDGVRQRVGFFTNVSVEAFTPADAEERELDMVREDNVIRRATPRFNLDCLGREVSSVVLLRLGRLQVFGEELLGQFGHLRVAETAVQVSGRTLAGSGLLITLGLVTTEPASVPLLSMKLLMSGLHKEATPEFSISAAWRNLQSRQT